MGQFQPPADPSTVWLSGLIETMDEVATSAAKPSAADRETLATRLELPAMPAPLGPRIHPANHRRQGARAGVHTGQIGARAQVRASSL
jgi:hypothetical protein